MSDRAATANLARYLRVAYDGLDGEAGTDAPAPRVPSRWAVQPSVAVRVAAAVLVLAVAGVTLLLLFRGQATPDAPAAPAAAPIAVAPAVEGPGESGATGETGPGETGPGQTGMPETSLVVHVAGAVTSPGIVEVPAGTRVAAAIEAAGGETAAADLDALNLAAHVTDGQQIYVPVEGEAIPGAAAGGGSAGAGSGSGGAAGGAPGGAAAGLVNINTADLAALDTLPGVGPAIAERIIAWRTENGPFASVEALADVSGIGPATMDRLRDRVTV